MRKIKTSSLWVSFLINFQEKNIRILFSKSIPAKGREKNNSSIRKMDCTLVFTIVDAISVNSRIQSVISAITMWYIYIHNTLVLICQYSLIFPITESWGSQEISYGENNFWQTKQLWHFQNHWCGNIGSSGS